MAVAVAPKPTKEALRRASEFRRLGEARLFFFT
jgi:hypothetical protein